MCAGALSCSSSGHLVSIPLRFSLTAWRSFSAVHCSRVQSWLSYVEGNPPAAHFCNLTKLWLWLSQPTAECETSWVALSWRASSALTPVWCLIPVMDSWFITSYIAGQNVVWVGTADIQQFWTCFHPTWLIKWRQKTWSPSSKTLPKQRWSCKIFRMLPYKIPTSLAICRTSLVDLPSSVFQQHGNNHPWSPQLAVQPRLNSATHLAIVAYNWAMSP